MTATILLLAVLIRFNAGGSASWIIAWPGTAVHELCHWIVGLVTFGQPDSMNIMPSPPKDGEQVLGSVSFNNVGWWNALPIGIAPLLALPIALAIAGGMTFSWTLGSAFAVWIVASVISQCWPSPADWNIVFRYKTGLLFYGAIIYLIAK